MRGPFTAITAVLALVGLTAAGSAFAQDSAATRTPSSSFPLHLELFRFLSEPRDLLPDTAFEFVYDEGIDRVVVRVGSAYAAFSREKVMNFLRQNPLRGSDSNIEEFLAAPWNGASFYGWLGEVMIAHRVAFVRPARDAVWVFIQTGGPDDVVGGSTSRESFNRRVRALVDALERSGTAVPSRSG
jgi:hypothetical protein